MTGPANTGAEAGGQGSTGTAQTNGQASGGQTTDGKTDLATLPADVQELIRNLRAEAKDHREAKETADGRIKELEDEVETAQTASRAVSEDAAKAKRALTIREIRDTYGLDQKAEKFLTAETEEELKEQAEALSAFATPSKTGDQEKPQEGQNSGGMIRVTDPAQQAGATVDPDQERVDAFFGGLS